MPIKNIALKIKDPFVMNEDTVNVAVAEFLISKKFSSVEYLSGNKHGVDVIGKKNGTTIYIESKGSHANAHDIDIVFDSNQIKTHTYMQISKLMEYANSFNENVLLVLANPDIPRIRSRVEKVRISLDKLGFIQFWVQEDMTVEVEGGHSQQELINTLFFRE